MMSLQLVLAFEGSRARDVLVMGSGPVVFLCVGGASFIFGPGVLEDEPDGGGL